MATIKKISGVTESTAPASSDWILMETTGGVFQKVKLSNLGGTHTHSYLPLSGGYLRNEAMISWNDSGTWDTSSSPKGLIGGLSWTGQSDYIKLRASENAEDSLELILQFGDDNSNGLTIQNKDGVKTARITASGGIEANNCTISNNLTVSSKAYIGGTSAYISYNSSTGALEFNC